MVTDMKTTRIRAKIKTYLAERPRSTTEILEYVNKTSRHGTTPQQLGNVLSKDKDIMKVGMVKRAGVRYGCYHVCQWALADSYRDAMGQ